MFIYKISAFLCAMLSPLLIMANNEGGIFNNASSLRSVLIIFFVIARTLGNIYILHYFLRIPLATAFWRLLMTGLWMTAYFALPVAGLIVAIIMTTAYNSVWFIEILTVYTNMYSIDGLMAIFNQVMSGQDLGYVAAGIALFLLLICVGIVAWCYIYRRHVDSKVNRQQLYEVAVCIVLLSYLVDILFNQIDRLKVVALKKEHIFKH